jgi:hypothetical protein
LKPHQKISKFTKKVSINLRRAKCNDLVCLFATKYVVFSNNLKEKIKTKYFNNLVFLFLWISFLFFSTGYSQDKIIKKEITPTPEELEKLKDVDPKKATYPTINNFKKEFENLPAFKKKYIPAPIAYTDPNTGYSFGAGVGAIFYDKDDKIRHIIAPFFHYNQNTEEGGTGRYIFIPSEKEKYYYKVSKSAKINDEFLFEYINKKFYLENASFSALVDIYNEGTARFYGIGRRTTVVDRLNYNQREQTFQMKGGYILSRFADVNLKIEYLHIDVKKGADKSIDQVVDVFKDDRLIRKHTTFSSSINLGFNLLGEIEEKDATLRLSIWGEHGEGIYKGCEDFDKWGIETKWFWQYHPKFAWAGAINYQEVHGNDLPFYLLNSLGGSRSMRGYELGRFYDKNLIQGMTEIRWNFYHMHKFGFITDWELAFFYDFGQVSANHKDFAFNHIEHATGVGIRTHFGGNLLTRIDVGISNEGFKVFVDFGYSF